MGDNRKYGSKEVNKQGNKNEENYHRGLPAAGGHRDAEFGSLDARELPGLTWTSAGPASQTRVELLGLGSGRKMVFRRLVGSPFFGR
jgi:hypothetical protein